MRAWVCLLAASSCNPAEPATSGTPDPPSIQSAAEPEAPRPVAAPTAKPAPKAVSEGPWEAAELTWRFDHPKLGEMVVVVHVPATTARVPMLVTMHGLGESE